VCFYNSVTKLVLFFELNSEILANLIWLFDGVLVDLWKSKHAIYTLYIRYIHAIYTLYIRYIYAIYTLYIRYNTKIVPDE